jgi:hypothetical protein
MYRSIIETSRGSRTFPAYPGWYAVRTTPFGGTAMAVKINAQVTGYGPQPGNTQALVIVTVEFDGPSEAMTFTVLVPTDHDEGMVREQAIARAQELARRFAELRRSLPPPASPLMPFS